MKKAFLLLSGLALSAAVSAQILVTSGSLNYSQNFNSLDSNATNSSNLPTGFELHEDGTGSSANNQYRSGNGGSNAGDTYSLGMTANADRALGSIASGSVRAIFGAKFTNNTGDAIIAADISYTGEQWRFGGLSVNRLGADTLLFEYSLNADSVGDTSAVWTSINSLDFLSPDTSAPVGALDGNDPLNQASLSANLPLNLANGASLYIRWRDLNIGGADDALAVDNLAITFATGTPPACPAPTNLAAASITTNSALLSWDAAPGAQSYEYVVSNSSQSPSGPGTNTTATTYNAASLTANTVYYLFVRSVCSATEFSPYVSTSFTTMPVGISPLSQNALAFAVTGVPSTEAINLLFTANASEVCTVSIMDITGRMVHTSGFTSVSGTNARSISGLSLTQGLYTVRLSNAHQNALVKISVQ